MTTQQLDYAPFAPLRRRKRVRRIVAIIVLIVACATAFNQRDHIRFYYDRARFLYFQRQCLGFSMPPDHVVYDDDPSRVDALLTKPRYRKVAAPSGGVGARWRHEYFDDLSLASQAMWALPGREGLLFLHGRNTPAGERFILACLVGADSRGGLSMSMYEFRPATWSWKTWIAPRNGLVTPLPEIDAAAAAGKHLRFFAGQADANDPTHFTVRYEIDGVEGFLDGYEGDRTEDGNGIPTPGLRLEIRKPK